MRYFKGAFTEYDLLWKCTWTNYTLYLASIDNGEEEKEKTEVKDSDDIF